MAVSENSALPVFLLGHSMGGFAVALYGAKYPNKNLRGIITSGALTQDNAGLVSGVPKGLEPHQKLPNELGGGSMLCSGGRGLVRQGSVQYSNIYHRPMLCHL